MVSSKARDESKKILIVLTQRFVFVSHLKFSFCSCGIIFLFLGLSAFLAFTEINFLIK